MTRIATAAGSLHEDVMPELPDLEVIRERLADRIIGLAIASTEVLRPIIVRDLTRCGVDTSLVGRAVSAVTRRGKSLVLGFDGTRGRSRAF